MSNKRVITNADIKKYDAMIEKFMRDFVKKNWNEASLNKNEGETSLGNSGWTMDDIRQHLRAEVCIALTNYNPEYKTKEGLSVKESTFAFRHIYNRCGQLLKRLTKRRFGYGVWSSNIEDVLWEHDKE